MVFSTHIDKQQVHINYISALVSATQHFHKILPACHGLSCLIWNFMNWNGGICDKIICSQREGVYVSASNTAYWVISFKIQQYRKIHIVLFGHSIIGSYPLLTIPLFYNKWLFKKGQLGLHWLIVQVVTCARHTKLLFLNADLSTFL